MSSVYCARVTRVFAEVCLALAIFVGAAWVVSARSARGAPLERASASVGRAVLGASASHAEPSHAPPRRTPLDGPVTLKGALASEVTLIPPSSLNESPVMPPLTTMLHGMCGSGANICQTTSDLVTPGGYLICPSGNVSCGDGWSDWHGTGAEKAAFIDDAIGVAEDRLGVADDRTRGDVLMGFSRGAFVARDVAYESKGRWVGLVLIGAAMTPDAEKLAAAGIRRVVLASGDFDGAKKTMMAARNRLCAKGIPARFVSLGPIPHALPSDLEARLGDSLEWVRARESTSDACST